MGLRVVSPIGVHDCVARALTSEHWECSTAVPRGADVRIVGPGSVEWRVSVAGDALGVDVLVMQGAAGRPLRHVWWSSTARSRA